MSIQYLGRMLTLLGGRLFPGDTGSIMKVVTRQNNNLNKCTNILAMHCYSTKATAIDKPVSNSDLELQTSETIATTPTAATANSSSSPVAATEITNTIPSEDRFSTSSVRKASTLAAKAKIGNEPTTSTAVDPLTDKFGRHHTYLRISLTERCNLRCKYCMPAEGVTLQPKTHLLTTEEIIYLARIFIEQGVRKIRLTGGEPTVRRDIVDIIEKIKSIPKMETVGITTNGLVLTRYLVAMQRAGLDSVNISLDTLKPQRFEEITRRKGWERVIAGIDLAIQLGYTPKVNCVLMRNFNEDEICDFVEFTRDRNVDVRFIEYMPFTGNKWQTDRLISFRETVEIIRKKYSDFQALPNGPNDTSKAYSVPGFKGQIGFITSMTEHFCGTCNRLRLTADGNIKVCLFGNKEFSLRDAIRSNCSESDLVALIASAVQRKKKQHAGKSRALSGTPSLCAGIIRGSENWRPQQCYNMKTQRPIPKHTTSWTPLLVNSIAVASDCRRGYCQKKGLDESSQTLTHIDRSGRAKMVDVSEKAVTMREASATACVEVSQQIAQLIEANNMKKGDVLGVAQIAGILGAKKTPELIPLCHSINLNSVKVEAKLNQQSNCVELRATVRCYGRTGVEMEALTAVSIAALTVYDMCKAVSHNIVISNIRLQSKSGGKRDFSSRPETEDSGGSS